MLEYADVSPPLDGDLKDMFAPNISSRTKYAYNIHNHNRSHNSNHNHNHDHADNENDNDRYNDNDNIDNDNDEVDQSSNEPIKKDKKISRNSPCPCGSGK